MRQRVNKFKEGAASFYMVAIATLILVIVAASFAAVVISELARTSNNDLAQSAYDSAMAGVEDAKLAYSNYLNCVDSNSEGCKEIVKEANSGDCNSVANILGRSMDENGAVIVAEGENNNMEQYYTCAMLELQPDDYVTTITSSNPTKVIKVDLADGNNAKDINVVRISWKAAQVDRELNYNDFDGNKVIFFGTSDNNSDVASPPTVGVGIIQTAKSFSLGDFEMTMGEGDNRTTDRGMIYLVPSRETPKKNNEANYEVGYDSVRQDNYISKGALLKSNDKTVQNKPYVVYCPENEGGENGGYTCTATIELPESVGGERSNDTFAMIVTLPSQGAPEIVASLEFCKGEECTVEEVNPEGEVVMTKTSVKLGMQVVVDVTGRANDLYRRVETRLEAPGTGSAALMSSFALQAMGGIEKIQQATCEANFYSEDVWSNCDNV